MTALSATVGIGNIVGVAVAIQLGGRGAVFWMWVVALLGMATKFSEAVLAVKFREIDDFEEIMLIGSGKGITSVSRIEELDWKRKKTICYKKINKIYNSLA